MKLSGEESNYEVLRKAVRWLERGKDIPTLIASLKAFLKPKEKPLSELEQLTIRARQGDNAAAVQVIQKMAEMNDGP